MSPKLTQEEMADLTNILHSINNMMEELKKDFPKGAKVIASAKNIRGNLITLEKLGREYRVKSAKYGLKY